MEKHTNPEVVIVGAGIGGSALATVLSRAGITVTILEKSQVHVDHVRGEWLAPWGVAETQRLGLYDTLIAAGGHHLGRHIGYSDDIDPAEAESQPLDFKAFEGAGFKPPLCMRHPDMCDLLNREATTSGAELLRGVTDLHVIAGSAPEVRFRHDGRERKFNPRIVIGADGRNSVVRSQVGIEQHRDPTHHLMAGMLVDNTVGWPADLQIFGTEARVNFLAFPQSPERVRLYICYPNEDKKRFAGADNQARFLDAFHLASVPGSEYLANGTPSGPCNSYGNEDTWTDVPYVAGRRADWRRRRPQRSDHRAGAVDQLSRRAHRARPDARKSQLDARPLSTLRGGAPRADAPAQDDGVDLLDTERRVRRPRARASRESPRRPSAR